jgi:hypothetical protein
MAFTGSAVFEQISERCVKIAGLSLASGAAGTISLSTGAGEETLPASFQPKPYGDVDLIEGMWLTYEVTTDVNNAALNLRTVKTLPASEWLVTITNDDGVNATGVLFIYVHFH